MSFFRRRAPTVGSFGAERRLPRAAACFTTPAMTRRAADWLGKLGDCCPLGILSDDCADVVWQCAAEKADLLLLEMDFSTDAEDTKDVSARCDIAAEVKQKRPECRVYLVCAGSHPERQPALDKAAELKLIDGYFIGDLDPQQVRAWIAETAEAMRQRDRPSPER